MLFVFPFMILLIPQAVRAIRFRELFGKDFNLFLFLCAVGTFSFVLCMKSDLGLSRDWDLYALFLYPSLIITVLFVLKTSAADCIMRNSFMILAITLIHTIAWISINASQGLSLNYFATLPNDVLWSQNDMARAMDELESYYTMKRDPNKALEYGLRSLHYNPYNVRILENVGIVYWYAFKDTNNAQIWLEKAVSANSKKWLIYSNLASIRLKQQDYQSAMPLLEKSIRLNPLSIEPKLNMAYLLSEGRGNKRAGYEIYQEILKIEPNNTLALRNAGILGYQLKDFARAKVYLQRYLTLMPYNPEWKKIRNLLKTLP
jgi:Tfp pilus assembly protein PilF